MAKSPRKGPRLRKAPTVKEIVEAQSAPKPESKRRIKLVRPSGLGKRLSFLKPLGRVLRPVGKVLSFLMPRYFINSWREVRQVAWPSRRETWRLTLAVFLFALIFGSMVAGVDKVIDIIFKKTVLR